MSAAESVSQTIPASRRTDWSVAGLQDAAPVYSNIVNITAFGGNGDGTTSNDAALQRAILSLGSDSGVVFFPAGTYSFYSPVVLRSGIVLRGVDAASTVLKFDLGGVGHLITVAGDSTTLIANVTVAANKGDRSVFVDDPTYLK